MILFFLDETHIPRKEEFREHGPSVIGVTIGTAVSDIQRVLIEEALTTYGAYLYLNNNRKMCTVV